MLKRLKRKDEERPPTTRLASMLSRMSVDEGKKSPARLRVPWKRRGRASEDSLHSSLSGSEGIGHTPSSSIGGSINTSAGVASSVTAALGSMAPFPLIRSRSSIDPVLSPPKEVRGRSLTEGEPPLGLDSCKSLQTASTASPTPAPVDPPLPPFSEDTDVIAYLSQLEVQNRGGRLCLNLAKLPSGFLKQVMHTYVSTQFNFTNEPIDIALRKFLLLVKLPLEIQHTERVLECFSAVYHEQNPWVFVDDQQAYFVVFSIIILHTDFFNKNVKHKMTKEDYVRSVYCEDIPIEFFEYIYENTTCAQFIHAEDDTNKSAIIHSAASTMTSALDDSSVVSRRSTSFGWRQDLIVDPYVSIIENNSGALRPNLTNVVATTDPFVPYFVETSDQLLLLRQRSNEGPTIQLVSQRSRPDAWQAADADMRANLSTQNLLQITTPGVVEIKVVKLGILMRREASKRMLYQKSSWREWGAILTESQLYLFKNVSWIKTMMETQSETIIRTPIDEFNATTISSTKDMAALYMTSAEQNQFILTGRGGSQQWFAGKDEEETIDWIHNINFAAAFSTYHVGPMPSTPPHHADGGGGDARKLSAPGNPLLRSASESSIPFPQQKKQRQEGLTAQIREIDRKIATIQEQINVIERDSSNLQMLMPLHQKTKEMVMFAVGQCSSKCEYCWLDRARLRCYRNMLQLDLKCEELREPPKARPVLSLRTETPQPREESPVHTPDQLNLEDTTIYHDAPSTPSCGVSEGVHIKPGRQFSLVEMNPDIVNSSPRSSNQSSVSLQPANSRLAG